MAYDYFCCYHVYREKVAKLSDQEVGRLFRALMKYSETGEPQELAGRESVAFDFIAVDIDKAKEKYKEMCKKNQDNAKSGAGERKRSPATVTDCKRPLAIVPKEEIKEEYKDLSDDKSKSIPDGIDRCTARQMQPVIDAWNTLGLQQIKLGESTTTRYRQLKARIKSYGLDGVISAIEKIKTSSFLQGDNTRNWVISFDWFIKPNNFPKVLEGNYDERKQPESLKGCKVPYGSAGQGPLGEFEQAALDRMLERAKEGDAT